MATEAFTWVPDGAPAGTISHRTRSAKFGDGYEQRVKDGINSRTQSWPLSFTGTKQRIAEIMAFLDEHGGVTPFYWTPPLGAQVLFRCDEYQAKPMGGAVYNLTATFEQAFHP